MSSDMGGGCGSDLEVHQFVPSLAPRDAVGNHTLRTHTDLVAAGAAGSIWAGVVHPTLTRLAGGWERFPQARSQPSRQRALLYQAASYSGGLADLLINRPEPLVLSYHNVTPPNFLAPYDGQGARELGFALKELRRLAFRVRVAIAASEFNACDLHGMDVASVHVIPPYLGAGFRGEPDARTAARLRATGRGIDLLFVGRLSPNKGHAHLIRLTAMLRAGVDPSARLLLVGAPGPVLYMHKLQMLIDRVAEGAVIMTGAVSEAELAAYYGHADVFVCLSDHEGFGVPLVEAMRHEIPVIAYDAGAVGETLGDSGVLVRTREPAVLAELIGRVIGDHQLRAEICRRQSERAHELEAFPRREALIAALTEATARG